MPALVIGGALTVWAAKHQPPAVAAKTPASSPLKVNASSSLIYTNVTAASLQPAAPPARSVTTAGLSPQPAQPNYCLPGEIPVVDGCVAHP